MTTRPKLTPEVLILRLGAHLIEKGLINQTELQQALELQEKMEKESGVRPLLGKILVDTGVIDRAALDQAITELILQLRNALQQANQNLERRVRERTAELEQALKQLSELTHLKSNFVANISHELRTPLTHLRGYLELLSAKDLGPLTDEQAQALQIMQRSANRLEKLIEDLILFSMADRGHIQLQVQPFDPCQICQALITLCGPRAEDRNIELELDCPPSLPAIEGDEEKITWALQQLLDNAIKFTPPGGKATLKVTDEDSGVRFIVIDNGIGIPAGKTGEIFEPFHQLDGSSTRKYGGVGLGLSLALKIIEAHGTTIEVQSQVGRGSQFSFLIQKADKPQASLGE